jgi:hypothetical protein
MLELPDIDKAVPVVRAIEDIACPIPVVRPEYVWRNCVPAVEVVEESVNSAPDVVVVSFEVEESDKSDPPPEITEVVCESLSAVSVVREFHCHS